MVPDNSILSSTKTLLRMQFHQGLTKFGYLDITYLWLKPQNRFCYLSVITDLYSTKVVGHCVHESLNVKGCLEALKQVLKSRGRNTQQSLGTP